MSTLELAESIARKAHEGQFRRDGVTPYITHPERVVARLRGQGVTEEVTLAVAWLHDVLEDTPTTLDGLLDAGVTSGVALRVARMRVQSGQTYEGYLSQIVESPECRIVKIADILDNLSDAPTKKQIVKYAKALLYLHNETP